VQPLGRDRVPAWAAERVHLSAYDSRWPGRAAEYANELQGRYAEVKSRLARAHADDRERYTDEKAIFVTGVLRDLDGPGPQPAHDR
jgi:GrpB-like predicted nucleotidyltransferase (UPF0157 family)